MITIKFPVKFSEPELIKDLQRIQSSMIRTAYSNAKLGQKELRKILKPRCPSEGWSLFAQSAIISGLGMKKADEELGVLKRIFGGKKNLFRRAKGLISNEEWKEMRLLPFYVIGRADKKGNPKFDFFEDHIIFKPSKGTKIKLDLPRFKNSYQKKYNQIVSLANSRQIPVTVSLTSGGWISLSVDLPKEETYESIPNRYAGIDLNPNYIGVTVWDKGILVDKKLFDLKDLTGKNSSDNKLQHETREIGHAVGRWLKHLRVDKVFVEKFNFKQGDKGLGRNFNRLTQNKWKKSAFTSILEKYFKLYQINAAWSSTIGNFLHPNLPDPLAASAEIARRGYDLVVTKKPNSFFPPLISTKELSDRWKETEFPEFKDWKELHSWFKISKMLYRVAIPEKELFQNFKCLQSKIFVYT